MKQYGEFEFFDIDDSPAAAPAGHPAKRPQTLAERLVNLLRLFFSGDILDSEVVRKLQKLAIWLVVIFAANILLRVWAVRVDIEYNALYKELNIVHDESVIIKERLYNASSHEAVTERLQTGGSPLTDPDRPAVDIK